MRGIPWKVLILVPVLVLVAIPTFVYGTHWGLNILSSATGFFYKASGPDAVATPTPLPSLSKTLPQSGQLAYKVQAGDNCVGVLNSQMNMADAGTIFSDSDPKAVKALNESLGNDCHALQPGMELHLSPQYPLIALGGIVQKIETKGAEGSTKPILPTPVANLQRTPTPQLLCQDGCILTVELSTDTQVKVQVTSSVPVKKGSWVWVQGQMARQQISGFANYPYVKSSLNDMTITACNFQADQTRDESVTACNKLSNNTIDDDGGTWLFSTIGSSSLDHWKYKLNKPKLSEGTQVLIWLSQNDAGSLVFRSGNAVYRYDPASHLYVQA